MTLTELFEKVKSIKVENSSLYFITRILKPDVKKSSKVLDKYSFKAYQVDINQEIRTHLYELAIDQFRFLESKKSELREYDVITDSTDQLFSYDMKNKTIAFSDIVNNQLKSSPPKVNSLEEIVHEEELWAYCVGFHDRETGWIYTFRKILNSKVAIDEKEGSKKGKIKGIRTLFNTQSQKLELLKGQTINLDKQIDCIFYDDMFYIAQKTQFEQIIGLEEEYKSQAYDVIKELRDTNMIVGLEILESLFSKNPSIHKKLVRLQKIGNYKKLDKKTINKIKRICKKFGEALKIKDDKLVIEDENDLDLVLKVLADYYKMGEVSGESYGTFSGKKLKSVISSE